MRRSALILAGICWLIISKAAFGQAQRVLVSVESLSIPDSGALASFHIDTWGVVPLAVCQIPPQWELKEEKFMNPQGFLSGRSDPYHRTLSKLDKLFLVDVYSHQPLPKGDPKGEYHPASFSGWYTVFDRSGDIVKKRRALHAHNFRLTPAPHCPDAPPAEP